MKTSVRPHLLSEKVEAMLICFELDEFKWLTKVV